MRYIYMSYIIWYYPYKLCFPRFILDMIYIYIIYNLVLSLQAELAKIYTGHDIYIYMSYIIWYYPYKLGLVHLNFVTVL